MFTWTTDQWIIFGCFTVAGLAALGLAAVTIRDVRRRRAYRGAHFATIGQRRELAALPPAPLDVTAHLAPGAGSLATLREVGEGQLITVTHADLVDPDVEAEVGAAFDRAMEDFRIGVEPAMRKARLWLAQAHGGVLGAGRGWLDEHWWPEAVTGEMPIYERPDRQRAVAEALLITS